MKSKKLVHTATDDPRKIRKLRNDKWILFGLSQFTYVDIGLTLLFGRILGEVWGRIPPPVTWGYWFKVLPMYATIVFFGLVADVDIITERRTNRTKGFEHRWLFHRPLIFGPFIFGFVSVCNLLVTFLWGYTFFFLYPTVALCGYVIHCLHDSLESDGIPLLAPFLNDYIRLFVRENGKFRWFKRQTRDEIFDRYVDVPSNYGEMIRIRFLAFTEHSISGMIVMAIGVGAVFPSVLIELGMAGIVVLSISIGIILAKRFYNVI